MTMKTRITLECALNNKPGLSPNSPQLREEEICDLIRIALDGSESERWIRERMSRTVISEVPRRKHTHCSTLMLRLLALRLLFCCGALSFSHTHIHTFLSCPCLFSLARMLHCLSLIFAMIDVLDLHHQILKKIKSWMLLSWLWE